MRTDRDWWALKTNQPELARRVHRFARSAKGKAMLTERGVDASMPMQLGIYTLFELIESTDPKGASQADWFFNRAVQDWTATGVEPDVAFLRRFAERVHQLAAEVDARGPAVLDPERPFDEADPGMGRSP